MNIENFGKIVKIIVVNDAIEFLFQVFKIKSIDENTNLIRVQQMQQNIYIKLNELRHKNPQVNFLINGEYFIQLRYYYRKIN